MVSSLSAANADAFNEFLGRQLRALQERVFEEHLRLLQDERPNTGHLKVKADASLAAPVPALDHGTKVPAAPAELPEKLELPGTPASAEPLSRPSRTSMSTSNSSSRERRVSDMSDISNDDCVEVDELKDEMALEKKASLFGSARPETQKKAPEKAIAKRLNGLSISENHEVRHDEEELRDSISVLESDGSHEMGVLPSTPASSSRLSKRPSLESVPSLLSEMNGQLSTDGAYLRLQEFTVLPDWSTVVASKNSQISAKSLFIFKNHEMEKMIGMAAVEFQINRGLVMSPNSSMRQLWEVLACVFVAFDLITVPYELASSISPRSEFTDFMTWGGRVFWTLDMFLGCFTGYEKQDGSAETDLKLAFLHHAKHELVFDMALVTTSWLDFVSESTFVKMLKLLRLLRLLKLRRLIQLLTNKIQSESMVLLIRILQSMLFMTALIHLVACGWLYIGLQGISDDNDSWVAVRQVVDNSAHQYAISFHWAVGQFYGGSEIDAGNLRERNFSCLSLLGGFFMATYFTSDVTSSMTRLHILTGQQNLHLRTLRKFLVNNDISATLSSRVQVNAIQALTHQQTNVPEADVELLKIVSEPLRVEIHFEMKFAHVCAHPLFQIIMEDDQMLIRKLCHIAIRFVSVSEGDILFSRGEVPTVSRMLFLKSGSLRYTHDGDNTEFLEPGMWVSEHVLWTSWVYHGLLSASGACTLVVLDSTEFRLLSADANLPRMNLTKYAEHFVKHINQTDPIDRSDIVSLQHISEIMKHAAPLWKKNSRRQFRGKSLVMRD